jgi:hypothetical protein
MMRSSTLKIVLKNWLLQRRSLGGYVATNSVYRKTDMVVVSGPFKGLKYIENSTGGAYFPKLLGTYEKELHEKIREFSSINFEEIINVGGGEGYFSVGFALKYPGSRITAFEPGFYGCYLMQKMAAMNQVGNRITIKAQLCMPEDLNAAIHPDKKTFVFMDVEGAELQLLDIEKVPALKNCTIMVEIHDMVSPTLGETIKARFKDTHRFTEIMQEQRSMNDLTIHSIWKPLFRKEFAKLMDEGRSIRMRWFIFEPAK